MIVHTGQSANVSGLLNSDHIYKDAHLTRVHPPNYDSSPGCNLYKHALMACLGIIGIVGIPFWALVLITIMCFLLNILPFTICK
jgi:hypothetical protein